MPVKGLFNIKSLFPVGFLIKDEADQSDQKMKLTNKKKKTLTEKWKTMGNTLSGPNRGCQANNIREHHRL
jgi:hypothetical protein